MASRKSTTKSDSPVAAREQLEAREPGDQLEKQAKDQEAQQRQELKAGDGGQAGKRSVRDRDKIYDDGNGDRASLRVAAPNQPGAVGGKVDNMSARHDGDVFEGHFCRIDLNNKDARTAVEQATKSDNPGPFSGDYGVYIEPAEVDHATGYPVTAVVRLRDDSNARVVVPYAALSPSEAGHR